MKHGTKAIPSISVSARKDLGNDKSFSRSLSATLSVLHMAYPVPHCADILLSFRVTRPARTKKTGSAVARGTCVSKNIAYESGRLP